MRWHPQPDPHPDALSPPVTAADLSGAAGARYADERLVGITDAIPLAARIHGPERAAGLLPGEGPVPVGDKVFAQSGS
ncbi:hypothetical protein [Streptomyces sp. Ag109_O5-1]|uniref:hypothetical protein n=1 Tax=Streptomyces sp. Ag109_O5-1 TaxID=1938851 RepID=UPI000F50561D|nr:hypothetical protein [Streptomyces sp. Ag109_O5-1]